MKSEPLTEHDDQATAGRPAGGKPATSAGGGVRAVARALSLLALLSRHESLALADMQQELGLPKSTIHRLLATLGQEGYVVADARAGHYRIAAAAQALGAGYTVRSALVDVGGAITRRVTRQIRWPLALGTLEGTVMVVRDSTMPYSPLAVQATTVGHRHGLPVSAMGLAYLAFCDAVQRDILREAVLADATTPRLLGTQLSRDIEATRRRGYGLRLPARRGDSATLALPVGQGATIAGVLSMTTFGTLMTHQTLARHLPVLRRAVAEIVAGLAARVEN
ncbi:MAG: helix-turn-helix domain-containing protein [Pigmentiphaga sp.]|nr:helix-turn-helix domain-containing protein [Pigmentiphaga sp.]